MAPMQTHELDVDLTHRLADEASAAIMPHFRALQAVDNKANSGFDPVTVADRAAERAIRDRLAAERPHDGVLGEEYPATAGTSGRTWILDPIDGTRGFIAGLPTWGVLIALAEKHGPTLGMMAQPFVGERFFASAAGAFHTGKNGTTPLRTRRCARLEDAIVACTSPNHFDAPLKARFSTLSERVRMVRYGTDCYAYALLAAGHIDLVIEAGLKPFDIAPFVPIVTHAGGILVDREGAPIAQSILGAYSGDGMALGDPTLLDALVDALT